MMKKIILPLAAGIVMLSCSLSKKTTKTINAIASTVKADSTKKDTVKKLKPYNEVITSKAITQKGVFTVHKVADRWYFEIPDSLLQRDMLVETRVIKSATTAWYIYNGDEVGESVIDFEKISNEKLALRKKYFAKRSDDSTENNMSEAIENSNLSPIVVLFDIKTIKPDSSAVVIDVTDIINSDNQVFSFATFLKNNNAVYHKMESGFQADKSLIKGIKSFPLNVEIRTEKTFADGDFFRSYELNCSIVLLPANPMKPRYNDKRIGYFTNGYWSYAGLRPVTDRWMINRWRLEPKESDISKYLRGELVEPKNPIIYYIDPATPKKWIPYLIQGVNAWQKAFEKAGFKNAIYALEAPVGDSTWSMDDARHSIIVYKASPVQNASGPNTNDPRTGEILETHINWYHNIQQLMHDWYLVQAGPNDPAGRRPIFDDTLMGELIRYVCTHEVGHTLGLLHNFGASSTVPVDSLRNKHYVDENGYCPSIMDYARFNYVAQPEDSFSRKELIPRIGIYDEWAIEWGYRWFAPFETAEKENDYLSAWATNRIEKDKRLWFGAETLGPNENWDPLCQSEDIGDNAMKAGYWGIQNLKRVNSSLLEWTKEPNKDYQSLKTLKHEVEEQFLRYLLHVAANVGGSTWIQKNVEQTGNRIYYPTRQTQKAAIKFLQDQLFDTPKWLLNSDNYSFSIGRSLIFSAAPGDMYVLIGLQGSILTKVTSYYTYTYLLSQQTTKPNDYYSIDELLSDLEMGIFKELDSKKPIDIYRRNLQKIYVEHLIRQLNTRDQSELLTPFDTRDFSFEHLFTDALPTIKDHLRQIYVKISKALPKYSDRMTYLHLTDLKNRINTALTKPPNEQIPINLKQQQKQAINSTDKNIRESDLNSFNYRYHKNCWQEDEFLESWKEQF